MVVVVAVDSGTPPLSATSTIALNISDVNDCAPDLVTSPSVLTLLEEHSGRVLVATITATDRLEV